MSAHAGGRRAFRPTTARATCSTRVTLRVWDDRWRRWRFWAATGRGLTTVIRASWASRRRAPAASSSRRGGHRGPGRRAPDRSPRHRCWCPPGPYGIFVPLSVRARSTDARRAGQRLDAFQRQSSPSSRGCASGRSRRAASLSGGEQQMLAIGRRAAHQRPPAPPGRAVRGPGPDHRARDRPGGAAAQGGAPVHSPRGAELSPGAAGGGPGSHVVNKGRSSTRGRRPAWRRTRT